MASSWTSFSVKSSLKPSNTDKNISQSGVVVSGKLLGMYKIVIYFLSKNRKNITIFHLKIAAKIVVYCISSLQCYSVQCTIAQLLRKMKLKNLIFKFLMSYLSETSESYQRVKICPYSDNNHDFINIWQ